MKIKLFIFWANKGDLLLKLKYFVIISLKNKVVLFFNSSSSITYILLNNSNIAISDTMSSS